MVIKSSYDRAKPYITKDGSEIRELMHPSVHGNANQSLAEAIVLPGASTEMHRHHVSEELYYITQGTGIMTLGEDVFEVRTGDVVCIPSGTMHNIKNTGGEELKILCCCSPPYSHEDTELIPCYTPKDAALLGRRSRHFMQPCVYSEWIIPGLSNTKCLLCF